MSSSFPLPAPTQLIRVDFGLVSRDTILNQSPVPSIPHHPLLSTVIRSHDQSKRIQQAMTVNPPLSTNLSILAAQSHAFNQNTSTDDQFTSLQSTILGHDKV